MLTFQKAHKYYEIKYLERINAAPTILVEPFQRCQGEKGEEKG